MCGDPAVIRIWKQSGTKEDLLLRLFYMKTQKSLQLLLRVGAVLNVY